jgi:hypothetical protein
LTANKNGYTGETVCCEEPTGNNNT